jgi:hypothetical protein
VVIHLIKELVESLIPVALSTPPLGSAFIADYPIEAKCNFIANDSINPPDEIAPTPVPDLERTMRVKPENPFTPLSAP